MPSRGRRRAISHMFCFAYASRSLLLVESVVQSAESPEQELSLLLVDVSESVDGLGGPWGTLGDFRGGEGELATCLGLQEVEHFSEVLLLLRLSSLSADADGLFSGETLRGSVVESGEVEGITGELLAPGLGAGWLHDECTVLLSQLP